VADPTERNGKSADIQETLMGLFMLLFEFDQAGQVVVAQKCGDSLVQFLAEEEAFEDPAYMGVIEQLLLCISVICNYEYARCFFVESTPALKICMPSFSCDVNNVFAKATHYLEHMPLKFAKHCVPSNG
jgi:hypothetical protein